jgi:hypothetical protein
MQINSIKYVKDFIIEINSLNGETYNIDLERQIREFIEKYDRFNELLNLDYFKNFRLNKKWNTIEWDNGFDICPDLLELKIPA